VNHNAFNRLNNTYTLALSVLLVLTWTFATAFCERGPLPLPFLLALTRTFATVRLFALAFAPPRLRFFAFPFFGPFFAIDGRGGRAGSKGHRQYKSQLSLGPKRSVGYTRFIKCFRGVVFE